MKKPICVICKFYNEPDMLPVWIRHYGQQVGLLNCYLLDHGTDDGSQQVVQGANIIQLGRSPQDDDSTVAIVGDLAQKLLLDYKYVLYADADEIIVADPARYKSLTEYASQCDASVVTTLGLEVQHVQDFDIPIVKDAPILTQRKFVWFNSAISKPSLTSGPVDWSPGFHNMSSEPLFRDLYLFHLRYYDRDAGLRRLLRSRNQPWAHPDRGAHQRLSDEDWLKMSDGFGAWPKTDVLADISSERVKSRFDALINSRTGREHDVYKIDLGLYSYELWKIPDRFRNIF